MSTGDKRTNIYLKKFLSQQQITENFFEYLLKISRETAYRVFGQQALFEPDPSTTPPLSADTADSFDIYTPLVGQDGPGGHTLNLDPLYANNVPFENENGVNYFVGIRHIELPEETEINVRTGKIKYGLFTEGVGELAPPDSVVDDGDETLTIIVDSVTEAGVSNAGRKIRVWLDSEAKSQVQAFETLTVQWDGSNNYIETATALGQTLGSISTDVSKYRVALLGPSVKRNTDLRNDPTVVFIGQVEGAGSGNTPANFDFTGVNTFFSLGTTQGILNGLFAFLVEGGDITWDLDSEELTFSSTLKLLMPNRPIDFDMSAQTIVLPDGYVAYIETDNFGGTKPFVIGANGSMPNDGSAIPIVMRSGDDVFFRNGALELEGVTGDTTVGRIDGITKDLLDFIGATNESDNSPQYSSAVSPTVTNFVLNDGDKLTRAIKKLEIRPGVVVRARLIDIVTTVLPSGTTATIDGVSVNNGDLVFFTQSPLEGLYRVSGIGTSVVWTKVPYFSGSDVPADGALLFISEGTDYVRTLWERTIGVWEPVSNLAKITKNLIGFPTHHITEILFDELTRTFTIQPKAPATHFDIIQSGVLYRVDSPKTVVIPDATGLYRIYFDGTTLYATDTYDDQLVDTWNWVATLLWDSDDQKQYALFDQRHGTSMSSAMRLFLHRTTGVQWSDGLGIGGTLAGDGTADADAQVAMSDGQILDEDLEIDIRNSATPTEPHEQVLDPIAEIPVYYRTGATGRFVRDVATQFPVKQGSSRLAYNLNTGGTWTTPDTTADDYFVAMWIFASNDINEPVFALLGQREDSSLVDAQANNFFGDLFIEPIRPGDVKILYRLIFKTSSAYTNTPKAYLVDISDYRGGSDVLGTGSAFIPIAHSQLTGLQNKDHNLSAINVPILYSGFGTFKDDSDDLRKLMDDLDPYFAQLQLKEHPSDPKRVVVTGATIAKTDSTVLQQVLEDLIVDFDGAEIDFETGSIYESDGTTPLGNDFTPASLGAGECVRYAVGLVLDTISALNKATAKIDINPAPSFGATKALAPSATFQTEIKIGQVVVQEDGGGIADITQLDIEQLGSGSGGGGGKGDSSFELSNIDGTVVTVKAGKYHLSDGKFLISGNVTTDEPEKFTIDLTSVEPTPAATTLYWLCVDLSLLSSIVATDTKQKLFPVHSASQFVVLTSEYEQINKQRFVPIGSLYTSGATWTGAVINTVPPRVHPTYSGTFGYTEDDVEQITSAQASHVYAHGLNGKPQIINVEYYDDSAGTRIPLNPTAHILDVNDTTITVKTDVGLPFDVNDFVEVTAVYLPKLSNGLVVSQTESYDSGWISSDPGATLAHSLNSKDDIIDIVVLEKDTTNGRIRKLENSTPVLNWDDTNIYVDFNGFPFTDLEYKFVTSPKALQHARTLEGNKFEFTAPGQLTLASTSYPCNKIVGDEPNSIRALQLGANGWMNIDTIGTLVWITNDGNRYLRGDIDGLAPSVANPVRIIVE